MLRRSATTRHFNATHCATYCATLTILLATGGVFAGPLNPPASPVASTGKTLTEVEPRIALSQANTPGLNAGQFVITQPGSYYLTGDMTLNPGTTASININASDVTLDLNGFSVRAAGRYSISITNNSDRVTVKNGSVANATDGIFVDTASDGTQIIGMTASASSACIRTANVVSDITIRDTVTRGGQYGVFIAASNTASTLTNVQCVGASTIGLNLSNRAVLNGCVVRDTGTAGGANGVSVIVGQASSLRNCQVLDFPSPAGSLAPGVAIYAAADSQIDGCTVYSKGTVGIRLGGGSTTVRNTRINVFSNGSAGIEAVTGDNFIADNHITTLGGGGVQLNATTGSTVIRNHLLNGVFAVTGTALSSNIIGPAAGNGNPTANTNPHANFVN